MKRIAIKSKIGVNIFFLPKAWMTGWTNCSQFPPCMEKSVNRMRARTIWIVSDGQTIQKQVPLDVASHKVCVGIWFAKKLELFETSMGSK